MDPFRQSFQNDEIEQPFTEEMFDEDPEKILEYEDAMEEEEYNEDIEGETDYEEEEQSFVGAIKAVASPVATPTTDSATAPMKRKGNPALFFAVIIGSVLVIAMGALLFYTLNKKRLAKTALESSALILPTDKLLE